MQNDTRRALVIGVADALGFTLGALAGWGLGRLLGFDFVGAAGYGTSQMVGLVFIVLGCGLGKWLARTLARTFTKLPQ
ncbi:hypothetical protein [Methylibium sp.]|uniref:hypothetical protein n=1 Tax=Methylibium sp. TaxID=2067992 RepID=UPI003D0DED45